MKPKSQHGGAAIEFAMVTLVLIPMLLGTIGLGLSMHNQLGTVQLARDAGHMYARGNVDFTLLGNQQILSQIAGSLNLSTTLGSGNSAVVLSSVRYIDLAACTLDGKVNKTTGLAQGCTNEGSWVFSARIVVGNNSLFSSHIGNPPSSIITANGSIALNDQVTNANDVASLTGFNPWNSTTDTGVPSGQVIYVSEAMAKGFQMPPFSAGTDTYAKICF